MWYPGDVCLLFVSTEVYRLLSRPGLNGFGQNVAAGRITAWLLGACGMACCDKSQLWRKICLRDCLLTFQSRLADTNAIMKKKPSNLGGYRPGAGRKPGPSGTRKNVSFTLPPDLCEFLQVASGSQSRSEIIEAALRVFPACSEWLQKKSRK